MSRIIIPRFGMGMQGFMRFQTINKFSGKTTLDTRWFPNTILDAGRNVMATRGDWMTYCQIGTDGIFPTLLADRQAETSLGNQYAGTNVLVTGSTSNGQAGAAPYYGWKRKTWRFPDGTFTGGINLSEAGVGWGADLDTLISRAPILDPVLATPTTVTPLADELLDVSYELRYYSPVIDVLLPQVTLDGIVYNTITRAAYVTGSRWSADIGAQIGEYSPGSNQWPAYDGDIGTVLLGPNGVSVGSADESHWNSAYSNNSYEIGINISVGSSGWNLVNGIRSIAVHSTAGSYQTQYNAVGDDATIPKTIAYNMHMSWILNWAEYIAPWELVKAPYALGDRTTHNGSSWQSDINNNNSEPGVADWTLF